MKSFGFAEKDHFTIYGFCTSDDIGIHIGATRKNVRGIITVKSLVTGKEYEMYKWLSIITKSNFRSDTHYIPNGVARYGKDVAVESLYIYSNPRLSDSKPPYVLNLPTDTNGDYLLQTTQDVYNNVFASHYDFPLL